MGCMQVTDTDTVLQGQGGVCDFSPPLGNVVAVDPAPGSPVDGPVRLNFEDTQITASAAISVDSISMVYAGFTNGSGDFVGAVRMQSSVYDYDKFPFCIFEMQFYITPTSFSLVPGNSFYTRIMSSPVRQLQWESGLDYIYVATESAVSVQLCCSL